MLFKKNFIHSHTFLDRRRKIKLTNPKDDDEQIINATADVNSRFDTRCTYGVVSCHM